MDDVELLREARAGDAQAWATLVERHCATVRRFFSSTAPAERVDDLTQETFTRVHRARADTTPVRSFVAYLLGIAKNVLREFVRERQRDPRLDLADVSAIDLDPRPSTVLVEHAEQLLLLEGLRRLSLEHQIVLMFFYWENLTAREIAEALGEKENTVRGRITRARERLREHVSDLERHGMGGPVPDGDEWAAGVKREAALRDRPVPDDEE